MTAAAALIRPGGSLHWQEGVDRDQLRKWLDQHGIGTGPVENLELLAGGTQNILVRFETGGIGYVLRRPSLHPRPDAERTIRREARVLRALAGTAVPHPRFIAGCDDPEVLGASFYVTEAVDGFNATLGMPAPFCNAPSARRSLGFAAVDGIVALSGIDPSVVGLDDFGKLDGFLERQVPRWSAQLASYSNFMGWQGPAGLGPVELISQWLEDNRPRTMTAGLMHGDYHLGNVLFGYDGRLAAIVDWELSTLGDPLLDLGRLLAAWPDPDGNGPVSLKIEPWHGFPHREELIDRYVHGTGRSPAQLLWFEVLACFKLGIILEGSFARASAGLTERNVGLRLHTSARALFARAANWIAQRG